MGIFRLRVFLMAAWLPIALAVAACDQFSAAPRAAVPTQTTIERGKMLVIGGLPRLPHAEEVWSARARRRTWHRRNGLRRSWACG
jgi:hypothetical protein